MMVPRANQQLQADNASLHPTSMFPLNSDIPLPTGIERLVVPKQVFRTSYPSNINICDYVSNKRLAAARNANLE